MYYSYLFPLKYQEDSGMGSPRQVHCKFRLDWFGVQMTSLNEVILAGTLADGVSVMTLELRPSPAEVTAVTQNWYCLSGSRSSIVIHLTSAGLVYLLCPCSIIIEDLMCLEPQKKGIIQFLEELFITDVSYLHFVATYNLFLISALLDRNKGLFILIYVWQGNF